MWSGRSGVLLGTKGRGTEVEKVFFQVGVAVLISVCATRFHVGKKFLQLSLALNLKAEAFLVCVSTAWEPHITSISCLVLGVTLGSVLKEMEKPCLTRPVVWGDGPGAERRQQRMGRREAGPWARMHGLLPPVSSPAAPPGREASCRDQQRDLGCCLLLGRGSEAVGRGAGALVERSAFKRWCGKRLQGLNGKRGSRVNHGEAFGVGRRGQCVSKAFCSVLGQHSSSWAETESLKGCSN